MGHHKQASNIMMFCYALIRPTLQQFSPGLQRLNLAKPLRFQKKQIGSTPRLIASIQAQPISCKDMLRSEIKRIQKYHEKGDIL